MKQQGMTREPFFFLTIATVLLISHNNYAKENDNLKNILQSAQKIAISIDAVPDEFVIAVSPVRQTLQIIHSSARLAGALISEVQNENYRKDLQAGVGDLNSIQLFQDAILHTLKTQLHAEIIEVPPLGSTAKYKTDREAQQERLTQLRNKGFHLLFDLKITAGIYGPEGEMFFRMKGILYDVKKAKTLWREEFVLTPDKDIKVDQSFDTFFNPFKSNMFSPRLIMAKNALTRWTDNNGKNFKEAEKRGVELSIAFLCGELQLDSTEDYYFSCGISKLYTKNAKKAVPFFEKAWNKNKQKPEWGNALASALYKSKKVDDAIKLGEEVIQTPEGKDYAPAYYNLAYMFTDKKKNAEKAKGYYQRYLELSGEPNPKLEKRINQLQKKR